MNRSARTSLSYLIRLRKRVMIISTGLGIVTLIIALLFLSGQNKSLNNFLHIYSGDIVMNPMCAISLLLAGGVVILLALWRSNRSFMLLSIMAGWIFIIEGSSRLLSLTGLFDARIDLLLMPPTGSGDIVVRMSYITGIAFILLGIVFILRIRLAEKRRWLQYILFALVIISLFSVIGVIYGIESNYRGLLFFKMHFGSSVCFLLISVALLLAEYNSGTMAVIMSNKTGGRMARLFLPFVVFFPLMIGMIDRIAEGPTVFKNSLSLTIFYLVTIISFFIIILRTARSSNNIHNWLLQEIEERKKAEEEADSSNVFVSAIYENIPNMVFVKEGAELRYRSINRAGEKLIGHTRQELLGKTDHDFFPKQEADFFRSKDKEVFLSDKPVITEEQMTTPDYGVRWLRTKKIGIRDENGYPIYMIGISEDITELKEQQEQLKKYNAGLELEIAERTRELRSSEERYYQMIDEVQDYSILLLDTTGRIMNWNKGAERIKGYKEKDIIGENFRVFYSKEDRENKKPDRLLDEAKNVGRVSDEGWRIRKDGSRFWAFTVLTAVRNEKKNLIGFSKVTKDITEAKQRQDQKLEYERRFRLMINAIGDNAWEYNFDTGATVFSENVHALLGYEAKDFFENKRLWLNSIHPDDRHILEEYEQQYLLGKIDHHVNEYRIFHKDGSMRWILDRGIVIDKKPDGSPLHLAGIHMDITRQKLNEEKIINDQKRYEAIFNSQYQFMGLSTPDGILTEANDTILEFSGLQLHEVIGKHCWECYWWTISPDIQQQLREAMHKAAQGEFIRYETHIIGKDFRVATIDFSVKPVFDDHGKIILLISEGRDITERKLLEQKASEQEEQIRLFVKHNPAAVAMFDTQMRYMVASDRWYKDYELTGQDIIGKSHYEIFPEINDLPEWKEIHQRSLQGSVEINEEATFMRSDGTQQWLKWEIHPWKTNNGRIGGIMMFTEVITDRIRAKAQLEMLNKQLVESNRELEQFAYVASHDLQEPLRMVSSFLQLLEKKNNDNLDDKAKQYIHFAVDGAERMKTLINDLLKFSRVGTAVYDKKPVDCNEVILHVIHTFQQNIVHDDAVINISRLPVIYADKTQIEQLFQNLIGNALKYKRDVPLAINIGCTEEETKWVFYVKDNGIGIDPKFFEKVFVIFQRLHAKNEYSGTGIGLAICKKIVERYGGHIWVESQPDAGSVFYFSFPKN